MFSNEQVLRQTTRYARAVVLAVTAITVGCASPGQPHPPALNLPKPAEKLTASRVGDQVALNWTTPPTTTDGPAVKGPITAVVCLDSTPVPGPAAASRVVKRPRKAVAADSPGPLPFSCGAVQRAPVGAGPSRVLVSMASALVASAPILLAYRVELENAQGRSAAPSQPVYVAGGAAPAPASVTVSAERDGALLRWAPAPGSGVMELTRTLISEAPKPAEIRTPARPVRAPGVPGTAKTAPRQVVLRPDGSAAADPGGMLDTTVVDGSTYTYVAQRVQTVTLGEHTLEMRSVTTPAVTLVYRDVFPPKAPSGLLLVPGGGFGEPASIDLSWEANFDSDMLGYNVYRSAGGGEFLRLNSDPVPAPAFRDLHVEPGGQYTYRVTAVDQRHNESAPSATAGETLRR